MRRAFVERWRVYVVWLGVGVSGIRPEELRQTLGQVRAFLPLARQVAVALGPWLAALLAARQEHGLAAGTFAAEHGLPGLRETRARPFEGQATRGSAGWLKWLLEAELRRLVWLAEAPEERVQRLDWLTWEVRYWALAVCLARIGQLYGALEQKHEPEQAQRLFKGALALVWHQALHDEQAA
jgi:hypothetical protein